MRTMSPELGSALMEIGDHGSVRVLTFDRPEKLNAFDAGMAQRAVGALETADDDEAVDAIVVTGTGRGFCAGVDLDHLAALAAGTESSEHMIAFNEALRSVEKPIIAAVNGMAVGIGCTMCLHMDLVVVGTSARFRTPFTKIGVAPEGGSSWLLPQQIGYQRAAWMLLSSEWVDATTAVEWGLAFETVPDAELESRAIERATAIAAQNRDSVGAVKRTLRAWRQPAIDAADKAEESEFGQLMEGFHR